MNIRIASMLVLGILGYSKVLAQRGLVSVDPGTGSANIYIPLLSGSAQVGLSYSGNGVRVKDSEGDAGLGWNLIAGGQVTRSLRGLPDDVKVIRQGTTRIGWLENNSGTAISNFITANNNSPGNCASAQTDLTFISNNFSYLSDTEPDLFRVSAPGLSCTFVFDKDKVIRTIPYQDLQITYEKTGSEINSFTVVNNQGTKYVFSNTTRSTKESTTQVKYGGIYWPEANIKYYTSQYAQFKGGISYNSSWMLSSIHDATGNWSNFHYTSKGSAIIRKQIELNVGSVGTQPLYVVNEEFDTKVLSSITTLGMSVSFTYGVFNNNAAEGELVSTIIANGVKYILNYSNIIFNKGQASFRKNCLRNITTDQCESPLNYFFEYEGESTNSGASQYNDRDSAYKYTDIWGYYTGIKSNGIAAVNTSNVNTGMLKTIKYYDNGSTTLEYESNSFYNPTLSSIVNGGGVRIKNITDYDGIASSNNMVRNYTYTNPSTGITSGVPISLPQVSFLRPVLSSATTTNSIVKADNDLSGEDHTILYEYVKENQTGRGSTLWEYKVPAGAFDIASPLGDWSPTVALVGVQDCSKSLGLLVNSSRTYPFAPATNYDFERGLLSKETAFNEAGVKVAESIYNYQRSYTPIVISGLKFDEADYAKVYSKYLIYTTTSELKSQVEKVSFDPSSTIVGQRSTTKFTYESSNHKELTQEEIQNSDGATTRVKISYAKDYTGGTATSYSSALVSRNINVPLEIYSAVKPAGSSIFKVTGGKLNKFAPFPAGPSLPDNLLPSATYQFTSTAGLTDFVPSLTTTAGTPDFRYILTNNFTNYDIYGTLKSIIGTNRQPKTLINTSKKMPLAIINNARPSEVGYGFYDHPEVFNLSNIGRSTTDRSSMNRALTFTNSCTLSKTVTKRTEVKAYVFSIWIKSSSSGSFDVKASTETVNLAYEADSSWKYYELNIPVGTLPNTFEVSFTIPGGISIDDVLIYPQIATVSTFGYNYDGYKIVETDNVGRSTYYDVDKFGRLNLVYDQDKQILRRKVYHYNEQGILPDALFYVDLPIGDKNTYVNAKYAFLPYNSFSSCFFAGATYSWDYGDGSASTTSNEHIFTSTGKYNVTLTVTVPGIGSKSSTIPITIETAPPPPVYLFYTLDPSTQTYLDRVEFMQGGGIIKIVYPDEFYNCKIPAGATTVKVYLTEETRNLAPDISVALEIDDVQNVCKSYSHTLGYTFSVNPARSITLYINPRSCE